MRLDGKVALVTHVDSETGVAIVGRFAEEGAQVIACRGAGVRAGEMRTDLPQSVLQPEGDISNREDARKIVGTIQDRFGRLDILINYGAGGRAVGTIVDLTEKDFEEGMVGDVWTVIALSGQAIPLMAKSGGGSIVNISSIARLGVKGRPMRSASQAAVSTLTRSMALDHAGDGIRVNGLLLGPTMGREFGGEHLERLIRTAPLGKLHTPEDVAAAALFLASDEARMITGALLILDAGRSLPTF